MAFLPSRRAAASRRPAAAAAFLPPVPLRATPLACAAWLALQAFPASAQVAAPDTATQVAQVAQVSQLPVVDVVGDAERAAGSVTTIGGAELEQAESMRDVVRYQPLVSAPGTAAGTSRNRSSFDRAGTTGYNVRGVEGNRVGMDIDGVEMPDATTRPYVSRGGVNTFGIGRDFIDPEMFSKVDVLSGTTAARRSAGGIGGAVSFRTKAASDYLRDGKTSYFGGKLGFTGADRSWNESVTGAVRSGAFDGLVAYSHRDGHELRNNSSIVNSVPSQWHSNALLLKGGWQPDATQRLELSADLYRRGYNTSFDGWNTNGNAITEHSLQSSDTERNTLQLTHLWMPAGGWLDALDTRLYYQDTDTRDLTDTTVLSDRSLTHNVSENKTRGWGFSSAGSKRAGRQLFTFGVNASSQDVDRPWNVPGYMKPQPDTTTDRLGAFVQDQIDFDVNGHRLAVIPALRVDRVKIDPRNLSNFVSGVLTEADVARAYGNSRTNTIYSPSLALTYDITQRFLGYAQFKRGGRAPSPGEIFGSWNMASNYNVGNQYALVGNQNLKPEKSNAFEVGMKGSPTPGVTLNSALFSTSYSDFIAYTRYTRAASPGLFVNMPAHIGTIYQVENRDEARIYGLELSARVDHGQWSPAARGLYTTWAFGASHGTSRSHYQGDKDVPLDSVLPRKAVAGVGYDAPMKRWGMNFTGTFVGGKRAVATNRESYANNAGTAITDSTTELFRVPGYAVFDLVAYWQISPNARLNVGLYNLGDKRYWDYSSTRNLQPAVGRDRRDIELLTNPGRTVAVSLTAAF